MRGEEKCIAKNIDVERAADGAGQLLQLDSGNSMNPYFLVA